jgi:hypothetical protein
MILGTVAAILALSQKELPKPAELRAGEVVRIYERSYGRRLFEHIFVLTPTKVFSKYVDARKWMMLTPAQQSELQSILASEPKGLRAQKRDRPMWPSAYDAQDIWMSYRINKKPYLWTNRDYVYPEADCPLTKFMKDIKTKLDSLPNE